MKYGFQMFVSVHPTSTSVEAYGPVTLRDGVKCSTILKDLGVELLLLVLEESSSHVELFQLHPSVKGPLDQTQNILDGLYIPSGLGIPWDSTGRAGR